MGKNYMFLQSVLCILLLFQLLLANEFSTDLPEWHMKPIGSHIKPDTVDETFLDNQISPEDFLKNYVLTQKPIIFRGAAKTWPAFKLWTDDYLTEKYGDMEVRLEAKKEKKGIIPKGDVCLGRDTIRKFISDYKKGADKYIVSDLPSAMYKEVHVPPPIACGDFLKNIIEVNLWVNTDIGRKGNGGNSILHKDEYNTMNCLLNGTKEWRLFDLQYNDYLYQSWEPPLDAGYGGFSLINPNKVNAKEFPDVAKIDRWQFATLHAGDCLHVPTQMWHSVKSHGEANRAIGILFSRLDEVDTINTTDCAETRHDLPLSEVDVDWPYSGTGVMPMGNNDLVSTRDIMASDLIDGKAGRITKRNTHWYVYTGHVGGAINKKLILSKAKALYEYLFNIADRNIENMTKELIMNLTRDQIRSVYNLMNPIEPGSSYDHEYAALLPEQITELINNIKLRNEGKIEKHVFIRAYDEMGGTRSFAENFWIKLAGDNLVLEDITETLGEALRPYEENRKYHRNVDDLPGNTTVTTPSGHITQPKGRRGYYERVEDADEIQDGGGDIEHHGNKDGGGDIEHHGNQDGGGDSEHQASMDNRDEL